MRLDAESPRQQEGRVRFQVGNAFYRRDSQVARDLGVLVANHQRTLTGQLRVLDGMTGCGVRPLRYVLEAGADWVWANDANPEVHDLLQANLSHSLSPRQFQITHWEASRVFADCYIRRDYYDLVDIDGFGNPAPWLSACLGATRLGGLIYLTSTDGRTLAGHAPDTSLRRLGAIARSHPAAQEQGLRLLIGGLLHQASLQGMGIQPIFSFFSGQTFRVMVRLVAQPVWTPEDYAFLGYCHACGHYQVVTWRHLSQSTCAHHLPPLPLTLSGPMWLGPLHDPTVLMDLEPLAAAWNWPRRVTLLQVMQAEATLPPYFFTLGEIGRRARIDLPNRDRLIQALQDQGYRASLTHINPQAIKTNAPWQICLQLSRRLSSS